MKRMNFSKLLTRCLFGLMVTQCNIFTPSFASDSVDFATRAREQENIAKLDAQIKADPNNALLLAERGQCYVHLKEWKSAFRDTDAAVRLSPNTALFCAARGDIFGALGDRDREKIDLERAVSLAPNDVQCLKALGAYYGAYNEPGRAIPLLTRAISKAPDLVILYVLRAEDFIEVKNLSKAKLDLEEAFRLEPGNRKAMMVKAEFEAASAREAKPQ